ncbi:hypothetical protein [Pseudomonas sp. 18175]|uniref:hypothetical protein n=1 Tax=Pseudomonas sp. 18175 TaxID=3390056 RepID=UPI003D1EE7AE
MLLLLLGVGATFLLSSPWLNQQPVIFWGLALGAPFMGWCVLSFGRISLYLGQHRVADGWDKARDEDLIRKVRQGRRVQQVLSVSLQTALREANASPAIQLDSLRSEAKATMAQPSRRAPAVSRHTRIAGEQSHGPAQALLKLLKQMLADLIPALNKTSSNAPLALLLEVDTAMPERMWRGLWQQAWSESGIRQPLAPCEGSGLAALDQWLDQRIDDEASLLVVALQFDPPQPEGTAEAAVGLLFGNRLTQTALPPIAYLHRPEQQLGSGAEGLLYAARQALDWVPLDVQSVEHVWQSGIDASESEALSTVLKNMALPAEHKQGVYDLDVLLGNPGKASPWLAIGAAAQTIQSGAGPQFIFSSGGDVDAGLWSTVLTPVPTLWKQEP